MSRFHAEYKRQLAEHFGGTWHLDFMFELWTCDDGRELRHWDVVSQFGLVAREAPLASLPAPKLSREVLPHTPWYRFWRRRK